MQALSLHVFENKIICSTDFIDHGILSSTNGIQRKVKIKGKKLYTVTNFKYPGAVVSHNGSKPEVFSRIEQATAAITNRKPIWRDSNIHLDQS